MAANGGLPDDAAIREQQQFYQNLQRKNDAELGAALGARYADWQAYQRSGAARSEVTRLREMLATSDEPLRVDQVKPLVDAIAREQSASQADFGGWAPHGNGRSGFNFEEQVRVQEEWLARTTQSHERIRSAVSGLLSPMQLRQLEEQQSLQRRSMELNLRQTRARAAEAQARGVDPLQPANAASSNLIMLGN